MFKTGATKFGAFADTTSTYSFTKTSTNSTAKDTNTKSAAPKFDPTDFVPKRFGLKYDPPCIILEYLIPSTGKLYHHKMKILQLKATSDTDETLEALKKKHQNYFAGNKVSESQIKILINKLKDKLEGSSTGTFITGNNFSDTKKDVKGFDSLSTKPTPSSTATSGFSGSKGFGSFDTGKDKLGLGTQNNSNKPLSLPEKKKEEKNKFWDFEDIEDEDDNEVDYNTTNLNKLSKEELDKHKEKMNNVFSKNQKKPGDAGFIYDKQEEFVPTQDNDWDEDF